MLNLFSEVKSARNNCDPFGEYEAEEASEKEKCFSWKEMNKLVLVPDSYTKLTWDMFANTVYLINIIISSSIIAFHMKTYDHFWRYELGIDCIVFIDMTLYFFTAFEGPSEEADEQRYNKNLKSIINNYLSTYFFADFISVVPVLIAEIGFLSAGWTPLTLQK